MRNRNPDLEPVVPDPKKLRKTALWLVAIILFSGVGIFYSYLKWAEKKAVDDRPAIVGRLDGMKDFALVRQDGTAGALSDLYGDVWVICAICAKQPESWGETRKMLQKLKEEFGGRKDFHLVCLTVDPMAEDAPVLNELAKELGAELPQWWLAGAGETYVHKFLKNTLRGGIMPHRRDDKWVFDPTLFVIDRDLHLRQATIQSGRYSRTRVSFDFEQAARWDAEGRNKGLQKSNVETLEDLLVKLVGDLLAQAKQGS